MSSYIYTTFLLLLLLPLFSQSQSQSQSQSLPQLQQHNNTTATTIPSLLCGDKCGIAFNPIPFPFHLNSSSNSSSSCGGVGSSYTNIPEAFRLTCVNSTSLFLNIGSLSYQVVKFFPDAVLVDFPNTTSCRQYNDLKSFGFEGNDYFGISTDNVVGLYDCEDSSLCKSDCEKNIMPGCDSGSGGGGGGGGGYPACCYPLSDQSAWRVGDGFSRFSEFGCRGFSCWVPDSGKASKRGVKLEWGMPVNTSTKCAPNAVVVNATTVALGMRCQCLDGFVGDGFAQGTGCLQSCVKDGKEAYGVACYTKKHGRKKVALLAGILTSAFSMASLTALLCVLKQPNKSSTFNPDRGHGQSTISFQKACRTRLFSYHELEEATKGFEDSQKLVDGTKGTLYGGTLADGSHVAVQKVHCDSERDLIQVLSQVEVLSTVSHRSMARLLGCSIDSGYTPLVVYEYPANGTTLEGHLRQSREQKTGLSWYERLNIAAETASVLAFLQCEISPPISHHDLQSGCILLDQDLSVKIAGFGLLGPALGDGSHLINRGSTSDVYNMGVVLLEMIAGPRRVDLPTIALQKIRTGKLEEIVDPIFYYHKQPSLWREQTEKVADLAMRCLLFGGEGKLGMIDIARELVHITKESGDGGSKRRPVLEETFSNSSLLQMISMSPDSIYVP